MFGNQNIFKDHARTAHGISPVRFNLFAVNQIIYSPYGCQRADLPFIVRNQPCVWKMVGLIGLEPMTPALSRRCSNQLSYRPFGGPAERGGTGTRTPDIQLAKLALYQLSYTPSKVADGAGLNLVSTGAGPVAG